MESELKDFPVIDACQPGWVERIIEFYWPSISAAPNPTKVQMRQTSNQTDSSAPSAWGEARWTL